MKTITTTQAVKEMSLFEKPVFVVRYGKTKFQEEKFELKTLAGCKRRMEREGITENYTITKLTRHFCDWSQHKEELIERG